MKKALLIGGSLVIVIGIIVAICLRRPAKTEESKTEPAAPNTSNQGTAQPQQVDPRIQQAQKEAKEALARAEKAEKEAKQAVQARASQGGYTPYASARKPAEVKQAQTCLYLTPPKAQPIAVTIPRGTPSASYPGLWKEVVDEKVAAPYVVILGKSDLHNWVVKDNQLVGQVKYVEYHLEVKVPQDGDVVVPSTEPDYIEGLVKTICQPAPAPAPAKKPYHPVSKPSSRHR